MDLIIFYFQKSNQNYTSIPYGKDFSEYVEACQEKSAEANPGQMTATHYTFYHAPSHSSTEQTTKLHK